MQSQSSMRGLAVSFSIVGIVTAVGLAAPTPSVGPEEVCGSVIGMRPSIAVDSSLQPHIITDIGSSSSLYIYHRINGQWSEELFAKGTPGGQYNASRLYMPHIEIDSKDRAWISCKFGCKEWGTMLGQGLWLVGNLKSNPNLIWFRWVTSSETHKGNGNVSIDPFEPDHGVVLATKGRWVKINDNRTLVASGNLNSGDSGEKIRFLISPRAGQVGVWHTVMGGYVKQSSSYQNSLRSPAIPVVWASYSAYPEQESDFKHPGLGIDLANPAACYMGVYYNPGLVINIWTGNGPYNGMIFDPNNLPVVDPAATRVDRFGPQFTPVVGGGAFVAWSRGGRVKLRYIDLTGAMGPELDICAGKNPSMCTDRNGNIHLAYINNGMRYRLLTLGPVDMAPQPVSPSGNYTCDNDLTFTWSPTNPPVVSLRYMDSCGHTNTIQVEGTSWPAGPFEPRIYQWQVRTNNGSWSASASFTVTPARPVPVGPSGALRDASELQFEWTGSDCTEQYLLHVRRAGVLYTQLWISATSWTPDDPESWPTGSYQWWVQPWAQDCGTQLLSGPVSATVGFQIACPLSTTLLSPAAGAQLYATNQLRVSWTAVAGASGYELQLNRDGLLWTNVWNDGTANTTCELQTYIAPAYYTWRVRTHNSFCAGPWTQWRTFQVNRIMTPSGKTAVWNWRPEFNWSPTPDATQYYLWIHRVGKSTPYYRTWIADTNWVASFDFAAGTYNWRIQPWDDTRSIGPWLNWATFTIPRMTPPRPVLEEPSGVVTNERPQFAWQEAQYAQRYELWVKRNGTTYLRPLTTETNYTPQVPLRYGYYQWWGRGWSPHGYGPWSYPLQFTYGVPQPSEPPNGSIPDTRQPTLKWSEVVDATSYNLRIDRNGVRFRNVSGLTSAEWTPETDLPQGNYRWWVQARNEIELGPWSPKAWFQIP